MNRYSPHYDHDEQRVKMEIDAEGGWVHINSTEARAVKVLEKRIDQLETCLRKVYKDNAGEVDQSFDPAVIEAMFECRECLDTGIVGYRAEDDAPLACTATRACRAKAGF